MADGLRVELSETALEASPDGAVAVQCTVYNQSRIVDEYQLKLTGIDPSWIEMPPATARIFPEAFETIRIVFRPPRSAAVAAKDYPFTITAISADNAALTGTASGTLTVGSFVEFVLDLDSPRQVSGEVEGTYGIRLVNSGNAQLTIGLEASEESDQVETSFEGPQVTLQSGESRTVRLTVRPKAHRLGAGGTVFQISVRATIASVNPPTSIPADRATQSTVVIFQYVPGVTEPPVLEPASVELAGQTVQTELILNNRSAIPIVMALEGNDRAKALTFEFVGGTQVTIPPGQSLRVPVRITCLDRTRLAPPPAPTQYTIIATPIDPAGDPRPVTGELTSPSPADFRLRLEPETVESTVAERVSLTIENVSSRPSTFNIAASSKDALLTVTVGRDQVEIGANDRLVVPVDLVPRDESEGPTTGAGPRTHAYSIRVAPADAPARANEVQGQYVFSVAAITMKLERKEIEAPREATYDIEIANPSRGEVSVALEASDRAGACTYAFDLPRLRIAPRGSALVRLTVTPPVDHRPDARWQFEVIARPTTPPGPPVRDEAILIYRAPTVGLTLTPPERKGRRPRVFQVMLTNPTLTPITTRLTAVDRSGGLGVQLQKETVEVPPAGRGNARVPLKVTPWKRMRGSGAQALNFSVAATPIMPPGDAVTIEGRFVALPPRSRWFWFLLLFLVLAVVLSNPFYPVYEKAFYWTGWDKSRVLCLNPTTGEIIDDPGCVGGVRRQWNGEHHIAFPWGDGDRETGVYESDTRCIGRHVVNGDIGDIISDCFAQGPPPPGEGNLLDRLPQDGQ
jgi:hypothetical protein